MALEEAVVTGAIKVGERLPAHRHLARRYGVGIGTVTRAIEALTRKGIVRGEVGRGTYVTEAARDGLARTLLDLSLNAPLAVVPAGVLAAAASRAARLTAAMADMGYGEVIGHARHRESLAKWLGRGRLACRWEEICITVGAQHALYLSFRDICRPGDVVLTESSTFSGAIAVANSCGLRLEGVPTDDEGMVPEALDERLGATSAKAIYTTPVCHNPLTFETGVARRAALLEVCRRRGAVVVEDDVYGIYGSPGLATYKEMAPDRVYYCSGLSKCLTPLLRIGVLLPPASRMGGVAALIRANLWGAPAVSAATACELIDSGADRAAEQVLRVEASRRVETARRVLAGRAIALANGPHVWLPMADDDARRLVERAAERGLRLAPPSIHNPGHYHGSGVRLCLMAVPSHTELDRALKSVSRLLETPVAHFV